MQICPGKGDKFENRVWVIQSFCSIFTPLTPLKYPKNAIFNFFFFFLVTPYHNINFVSFAEFEIENIENLKVVSNTTKTKKQIQKN